MFVYHLLLPIEFKDAESPGTGVRCYGHWASNPGTLQDTVGVLNYGAISAAPNFQCILM